MTSDPATLTKLAELLNAIRRYPDPRRASAEWGQVYRLLQKSGMSAERFAELVGMRDVEALTALIGELQDPASVAAAPAAPDAETCLKALEAFRKRFELMELDEQSRINSRNPLSKGVTSSITGIFPPRDWPEHVWQELVRQGKLRYLGRGLYSLAKT